MIGTEWEIMLGNKHKMIGRRWVEKNVLTHLEIQEWIKNVTGDNLLRKEKIYKSKSIIELVIYGWKNDKIREGWDAAMKWKAMNRGNGERGMIPTKIRVKNGICKEWTQRG